MAATFRTRPRQLLAPLARPTFAPAPTPASLLWTNKPQARHYAGKTSRRMHPNFRTAARNSMKAQAGQAATATLTPAMMEEQLATMTNKAEVAVLAPRTIIPLRWKVVHGWAPDKLFTYFWEFLVQRIMDRLQIVQQGWKFKPSFFSRSPFRADRKGVVEDALALHAEMSQCLATGGSAEKARLEKLCVPKLQRSLVAAIDARPPGRSYAWERVELRGKPFWPRLIDHKWTDIDVGFAQSFRQAVVGIKSLQRLTELDAKGKEVGEPKEMEVVEYVVLWKLMDKETQTQGDWQIYGTLKETSFAELMREKADMQKMGNFVSADKIKEQKKKLEDEKAAKKKAEA